MERSIWLAVATSLFLIGNVSANDAHNRCAAPMRPSANVSPADDAIHLNPDGTYKYVYEEWFWDTVLVGSGKTYGVETIVFQFTFGPLVINVVQIALTDVATGEYQSQLVWGGGGYPNVPGGFNVNISDGAGSFTAVGGGGTDHLEFHYSDGSVANITYEGLKNPSPSFFDGFGDYRDQITGKSHGAQYYLERRSMLATGTIARPGQAPVNVAGVGWYDRQWGSVIGTPGTPADNTYWKWFSIHLSDDTDYMIWDMYAVDTGNSLIRVANKIGAAPACAESTFTNLTITGLGNTVFNAGPPPSTLELDNHISIPDDGLELDVREITPNQIITSGGLFSPFIEGAMTALGTKNGRRVIGTGYAEQFVAPGGCCQSP
jgi:hypothetical protein